MLHYAASVSKVKNPRILFLNTASSSFPQYTNSAKENIESVGGAFSTFDFFDSIRKDYRNYFLEHDVIYVGGGNTRSMLALWREYGIDEILYEANERGTVLTGFSAGGICWFEQGLTDSLDGTPQVLPALGFLKGSACPHYDVEETRRPTYLEKIHSAAMFPGYALNDYTALHFKEGVLLKALTTKEGVNPVFVSKDGTEEVLPAEIIPS